MMSKYYIKKRDPIGNPIYVDGIRVTEEWRGIDEITPKLEDHWKKTKIVIKDNQGNVLLLPWMDGDAQSEMPKELIKLIALIEMRKKLLKIPDKCQENIAEFPPMSKIAEPASSLCETISELAKKRQEETIEMEHSIIFEIESLKMSSYEWDKDELSMMGEEIDNLEQILLSNEMNKTVKEGKFYVFYHGLRTTFLMINLNIYYDFHAKESRQAWSEIKIESKPFEKPIEKIHWLGNERELVYVIDLLIKKRLIPSERRHQLIADHFKKRDGKDFNPGSLSNVLHQIKFQKFKNLSELAE